jgi:Uri superfamily endonuclease
MIHTLHPDLSRIGFTDFAPQRHNKGTYILIIELTKAQEIRPGKLPGTEFKKGIYLYIGRAKRALQARLKHHLSSQKKAHWHIDFLLNRAHIKEIWIKENFFDECRTARRIRELFPSVQLAQNGFGSSDCRCPGHLLYSLNGLEELKSIRKRILFKKVKSYGNCF